jgi:hypothetical protein
LNRNCLDFGSSYSRFRDYQDAAQFYLMTSSKKGVSAHQLHRTFQITYEAAWFMSHRIRESMRLGAGRQSRGSGRNLRLEGQPKRRGAASHKNTVFPLVERGGSARSFHQYRYLSEFDFRYSNRIALGVDDWERRTLAIKNAAGKRLTYRGRH